MDVQKARDTAAAKRDSFVAVREAFRTSPEGTLDTQYFIAKDDYERAVRALHGRETALFRKKMQLNRIYANTNTAAEKKHLADLVDEQVMKGFAEAEAAAPTAGKLTAASAIEALVSGVAPLTTGAHPVIQIADESIDLANAFAGSKKNALKGVSIGGLAKAAVVANMPSEIKCLASRPARGDQPPLVVAGLKNGLIVEIRPDGTYRNLANMSNKLYTQTLDIGLGIQSLAFSPSGNGRLYVAYTAPLPSSRSELVGLDWGGVDYKDLSADARFVLVVGYYSVTGAWSTSLAMRVNKLLEIPMAMASTTIGTQRLASLAFDGSGMLLVAVSDGMEESNSIYFAQSAKSLLGGVLRIDPESMQQGEKREDIVNNFMVNTPGHIKELFYNVPRDNPLGPSLKNKGITFDVYAHEKWVVGVHQPAQIFWSPRLNRALLADNGQQHMEINLLAPGANAYWPMRDGEAALLEDFQRRNMDLPPGFNKNRLNPIAIVDAPVVDEMVTPVPLVGVVHHQRSDVVVIASRTNLTFGRIPQSGGQAFVTLGTWQAGEDLYVDALALDPAGEVLVSLSGHGMGRDAGSILVRMKIGGRVLKLPARPRNIFRRTKADAEDSLWDEFTPNPHMVRFFGLKETGVKPGSEYSSDSDDPDVSVDADVSIEWGVDPPARPNAPPADPLPGTNPRVNEIFAQIRDRHGKILELSSSEESQGASDSESFQSDSESEEPPEKRRRVLTKESLFLDAGEVLGLMMEGKLTDPVTIEDPFSKTKHVLRPGVTKEEAFAWIMEQQNITSVPDEKPPKPAKIAAPPAPKRKRAPEKYKAEEIDAILAETGVAGTLKIKGKNPTPLQLDKLERSDIPDALQIAVRAARRERGKPKAVRQRAPPKPKDEPKPFTEEELARAEPLRAEDMARFEKFELANKGRVPAALKGKRDELLRMIVSSPTDRLRTAIITELVRISAKEKDDPKPFTADELERLTINRRTDYLEFDGRPPTDEEMLRLRKGPNLSGEYATAFTRTWQMRGMSEKEIQARKDEPERKAREEAKKNAGIGVVTSSFPEGVPQFPEMLEAARRASMPTFARSSEAEMTAEDLAARAELYDTSPQRIAYYLGINTTKVTEQTRGVKEGRRRLEAMIANNYPPRDTPMSAADARALANGFGPRMFAVSLRNDSAGMRGEGTDAGRVKAQAEESMKEEFASMGGGNVEKARSIVAKGDGAEGYDGAYKVVQTWNAFAKDNRAKFLRAAGVASAALSVSPMKPEVLAGDFSHLGRASDSADYDSLPEAERALIAKAALPPYPHDGAEIGNAIAFTSPAEILQDREWRAHVEREGLTDEEAREAYRARFLGVLAYVRTRPATAGLWWALKESAVTDSFLTNEERWKAYMTVMAAVRALQKLMAMEAQRRRLATGMDDYLSNVKSRNDKAFPAFEKAFVRMAAEGVVTPVIPDFLIFFQGGGWLLHRYRNFMTVGSSSVLGESGVLVRMSGEYLGRDAKKRDKRTDAGQSGTSYVPPIVRLMRRSFGEEPLLLDRENPAGRYDVAHGEAPPGFPIHTRIMGTPGAGFMPETFKGRAELWQRVKVEDFIEERASEETKWKDVLVERALALMEEMREENAMPYMDTLRELHDGILDHVFSSLDTPLIEGGLTIRESVARIWPIGRQFPEWVRPILPAWWTTQYPEMGYGVGRDDDQYLEALKTVREALAAQERLSELPFPLEFVLRDADYDAVENRVAFTSTRDAAIQMLLVALNATGQYAETDPNYCAIEGVAPHPDYRVDAEGNKIENVENRAWRQYDQARKQSSRKRSSTSSLTEEEKKQRRSEAAKKAAATRRAKAEAASRDGSSEDSEKAPSKSRARPSKYSEKELARFSAGVAIPDAILGLPEGEARDAAVAYGQDVKLPDRIDQLQKLVRTLEALEQEKKAEHAALLVRAEARLRVLERKEAAKTPEQREKEEKERVERRRAEQFRRVRAQLKDVMDKKKEGKIAELEKELTEKAPEASRLQWQQLAGEVPPAPPAGLRGVSADLLRRMQAERVEWTVPSFVEFLMAAEPGKPPRPSDELRGLIEAQEGEMRAEVRRSEEGIDLEATDDERSEDSEYSDFEDLLDDTDEPAILDPERQDEVLWPPIPEPWHEARAIFSAGALAGLLAHVQALPVAERIVQVTRWITMSDKSGDGQRQVKVAEPITQEDGTFVTADLHARLKLAQERLAADPASVADRIFVMLVEMRALKVFLDRNPTAGESIAAYSRSQNMLQELDEEYGDLDDWIARARSAVVGARFPGFEEGDPEAIVVGSEEERMDILSSLLEDKKKIIELRALMSLARKVWPIVSRIGVLERAILEANDASFREMRAARGADALFNGMLEGVLADAPMNPGPAREGDTRVWPSFVGALPWAINTLQEWRPSSDTMLRLQHAGSAAIDVLQVLRSTATRRNNRRKEGDSQDAVLETLVEEVPARIREKGIGPRKDEMLATKALLRAALKIYLASPASSSETMEKAQIQLEKAMGGDAQRRRALSEMQDANRLWPWILLVPADTDVTDDTISAAMDKTFLGGEAEKEDSQPLRRLLKLWDLRRGKGVEFVRAFAENFTRVAIVAYGSDVAALLRRRAERAVKIYTTIEQRKDVETMVTRLLGAKDGTWLGRAPLSPEFKMSDLYQALIRRYREEYDLASRVFKVNAVSRGADFEDELSPLMKSENDEMVQLSLPALEEKERRKTARREKNVRERQARRAPGKTPEVTIDLGYGSASPKRRSPAPQPSPLQKGPSLLEQAMDKKTPPPSPQRPALLEQPIGGDSASRPSSSGRIDLAAFADSLSGHDERNTSETVVQILAVIERQAEQERAWRADSGTGGGLSWIHEQGLPEFAAKILEQVAVDARRAWRKNNTTPSTAEEYEAKGHSITAPPSAIAKQNEQITDAIQRILERVSSGRGVSGGIVFNMAARIVHDGPGSLDEDDLETLREDLSLEIGDRISAGSSAAELADAAEVRQSRQERVDLYKQVKKRWMELVGTDVGDTAWLTGDLGDFEAGEALATAMAAQRAFAFTAAHLGMGPEPPIVPTLAFVAAAADADAVLDEQNSWPWLAEQSNLFFVALTEARASADGPDIVPDTVAATREALANHGRTPPATLPSTDAVLDALRDDVAVQNAMDTVFNWREEYNATTPLERQLAPVWMTIARVLQKKEKIAFINQ